MEKTTGDSRVGVSNDSERFPKRIKTAMSSDRQQTQEIRVVDVVFQGNDGYSNSVTHYYHFLFAALFPLLEYHIQYRPSGYRIRTDIGPMKSLLCELPINIISFEGPSRTLQRSDVVEGSEIIALPAYDNFLGDLYEDPLYIALSKSTIDKVHGFLRSSIPQFITCIPTCEILLVERTNRERYYVEIKHSEIDSKSGSTLRRINNHVDLLAELTSRYGDRVRAISLERASMYYQYHMFNNCRLLIAQHGAALSNVVFMQPGSNVIEINPSEEYVRAAYAGQNVQKPRTHFQNLAAKVRVNHTMLHAQETDDVGNVCIEEVIASVDSITSTWG